MAHTGPMAWRSSAFRCCFTAPEALSSPHISTGCLFSLTFYSWLSFLLLVDVLGSGFEPSSQVGHTNVSETKQQPPDFNLFVRVVATLLVLCGCALIGIVI